MHASRKCFEIQVEVWYDGDVLYGMNHPLRFVKLCFSFAVHVVLATFIVLGFFALKQRVPVDFFIDAEIAETSWSWIRDFVIIISGALAFLMALHVLLAIPNIVAEMFLLLKKPSRVPSDS